MDLAIERLPHRDPLGVLRTTREVVERSRWVRINRRRLHDLSALIASAGPPSQDWDVNLHPAGSTPAETTNLILVLDALNFCFWSLPGSATPRWSVTHRGTRYDGYLALATALRRAVESGVPLADPGYLANLTESDVAGLLAGDPGTAPIPLIEHRLRNLREAGTVLQEHWSGTFLTAILESAGSAAALVREVVEVLPSFNDTAEFRGRPVRFHKRAQILIADLYGAFEGRGPGEFYDLDVLTAFADYKVPQVLRHFEVLEYEPELEQAIRKYEIVPAGSAREIEIRAATIWAIELLRRILTSRGHTYRAFEIDWFLWQASQELPPDAAPYHRTLTPFY